ncbi:MAG: hypothetical protein IJH34_05625, partial [Romboutsia sp.]|nr:hypothetical protein [Romboutsia sp.]
TKPSNIASYEIQKQSGNGWITIGSTYTGNKTITVSDNGTSTYHVVGKGTDGSYCTSNTVEVKIDKDKPECGTPSGASTSWIKGSRTITQPCTDTGGSGCVKDSYEQTFSNTKLGTITIADNAGNTTNCSVNVYSDGAAPTCGTVSGASTSWLKGSRTITQACNDTGGSGCVKSSYAQTFSNTKVGTITIADNAGNTKDCSVNAYTDTTAPTCGTVTGASTTYVTTQRTIKVACSDSGSGCVKNPYEKTFYPTSSNQTTANIAIADNVGNSRNCSVNVYIKACGAPSLSGSIHTGKECPCKSSETLTNNKRADFTIGGCTKNSSGTTKISGYVCYYNTSSTSTGWSSDQKRHNKIVELGCETAKCTYKSGWHGSCNGSNHGCFTSATKWYLNRSTECSYIKVTGPGGTNEMTCNMSTKKCVTGVSNMIKNC